MDTPRFNHNDIKHALRQHGYTMTSWANANGYRFRDVSDVARGIRYGNYGKGREIAEKLSELTKIPNVA
ncbi:MAG: hypothetical protein CTY18_03035 [Methylomonas sp.]|nr:MAG: hypothetical protein CTY18_03035 [Methylomonas sp.]